MDKETLKFVENAMKVLMRLKEAENLLQDIDMADELRYTLPGDIKQNLNKFFNKV